jgi:glycosyltransferase involved in cell wall biosynthesis
VRIIIVICTWNRCELLRQTLTRLSTSLTLDGVTVEILVVNNASTDATSDVVARFVGTLAIREVRESQPGLSNARNRALSEIPRAVDYIIWIDDDVLVSPDWLASFVAGVRRYPHAAAFGGPIDPWFVVEPDPILASAFPVLASGFCGLNHGSSERPLTGEEPIYGANMAFSMAAVRNLQFDPALGTVQGSGVASEEVAFQEAVRRRGGIIIWIPGMHVRHYVEPTRMTLSYLTRFTYDRGRTFMRTYSRPEPHLLGVPRWVLKLAARRFFIYATLRFLPFKRAALSGLRDYHYSRGMLDESFAKARARSQ